jgi:hypothetical protein
MDEEVANSIFDKGFVSKRTRGTEVGLGFCKQIILQCEGGVSALLEKSRRTPNLKNRVDEATENAVLNFAIEFPAFGQLRASNELRKHGVFVSPSGVRSIWLRHDLESMKQRLIALEKKEAALYRCYVSF